MQVSFILKHRSNSPLTLASMTTPKFAGHKKPRVLRHMIDTGMLHVVFDAPSSLVSQAPHVCIIRNARKTKVALAKGIQPKSSLVVSTTHGHEWLHRVQAKFI
jgi:hypothetical protein